MLRMRHPFDDPPARRRSTRVPVILTGAVILGALVLSVFAGSTAFFSFDPERECEAQVTGDAVIDADDPTSVSVALSQSAFPCADEVVVVRLGEPAALRTAARRAVAGGAPLLLVPAGGTVGDTIVGEIDRLEPDLVVGIGLAEAGERAISEIEGVDLDLMAPDPEALDPQVPETHGGPMILLETGLAETLPAAQVVAMEAGGTVLVVEELNLAALPDPTRLALDSASALRLVGGFDDSVVWQLELSRSGIEIPGGGQIMFPGRRFVAFYGNPISARLGVLGEQGPAETAERLATRAEPYGADGAVVVPTFEIIATVASSEPGDDGDFSDELSIETLRPWIDYAAQHGLYVVLDLQPGRSDFLSQASRYEELLRLPHVGLALDPEWRLGAGEEHLEQIGSVDAAEINEVAEWLAGIVREEVLPQKLLVVHQFRTSMITNREMLDPQPELATVIQMDGQGPLATKDDTWEALTDGWTADNGYSWGWKNFFDEDAPMAGPEHVLAQEPTPVFVSFQ